MRDLLAWLVTLAGMKLDIVEDREGIVGGPREIVGDATKLKTLVPWRPTISIESSLAALLRQAIDDAAEPSAAAA